jgi:tetratricopeptide (TPR) repeat protein/DNA-binding CsgD family transcriptional regulator
LNLAANIRIVVLIVFTIQSLLLWGNGDDQQQVIDSLNQVVKEAQSDSVVVFALVRLSQAYGLYNLKASIRQAEKALDVANKSGDTGLIEYAMFNTGNAYFTQGIFETATAHYYAYLEIQKEKNNNVGIALVLANIGAVRYKMKDYGVARDSFLEALQILEELSENNPDQKYRSQIPKILNNLGQVYQNMQQYDSSLYYYRKSLLQIEYVGEQAYYQSSTLNNIGSLFLDINQADSAFVYLSKAMNILVQTNDLVAQAESHNSFARYYLLVNQPDVALEHLRASFEIANKIGSIELQFIASEQLYDYYFSQNQADSALKYFVLYDQLKDTINNAETLKELTRLELSSQFSEQQKIRQLEQDRLNTIYMFTAALLVLVLLLFALLYLMSHNRNKRLNLEKENMALNTKNTILENKNLQNELEVRNKELTTHVMNMIQKNELIGQVVEVLSDNKLKLAEKNENTINNVIKNLNKVQEENAWEEFELRYQQVHNEFYEKLQSVAPNLTTNERRLCAFLRLNMTTKDIASITGQSLRSIEVARTRLRKKLDISNSDISLVEFLNSL